jgi:hypothetical protein
MLALYSPKYIKKILKNAQGVKCLVLFRISYIAGELKAEVVSVKEICDDLKIFCLPSPKASKISMPAKINTQTEIVSPWLSLFFFNSQPTRAPNIII